MAWVRARSPPPAAARRPDLEVAVDCVDDRIDKQRLAGALTSEEVGVRARERFEQLAKDQVRTPQNQTDSTLKNILLFRKVFGMPTRFVRRSR